VDDRLVHGQVVVGWGRALKLRLLVLVDDAIRASPWEQDLYRMGVPGDMRIEFASVAESPEAFAGWAEAGEHGMVLVGGIDTLTRLCAVAPVTRVNLGGVHQGPDRRQRLSYVYLTDAEAEQLRTLAARGIAITAQDVPTAPPVPLLEVLG
jgi:PTS system mannose-specific IIB component/fructoselysine and glucoselysine-specific PTS system IIB component